MSEIRTWEYELPAPLSARAFKRHKHPDRDPMLPLLGLYTNESKAGAERALSSYLHCGIIHNRQDIKLTKVSTNEQRKYDV